MRSMKSIICFSEELLGICQDFGQTTIHCKGQLTKNVRGPGVIVLMSLFIMIGCKCC